MRRLAAAWLESAHDDLEVAEEIIHRDDLTHRVAFQCQQAIEKSYKAVLVEYKQTVPRVHNLITLHTLIEKYIKLDVDSDILNRMNKIYIDARYPSDLGLLPEGNPQRN